MSRLDRWSERGANDRSPGMFSAAASLGVSLLWDTDEGLSQIDKYAYATEDHIKVRFLFEPRRVGVLTPINPRRPERCSPTDSFTRAFGQRWTLRSPYCLTTSRARASLFVSPPSSGTFRSLLWKALERLNPPVQYRNRVRWNSSRGHSRAPPPRCWRHDRFDGDRCHVGARAGLHLCWILRRRRDDGDPADDDGARGGGAEGEVGSFHESRSWVALPRFVPFLAV